MLLRPGNAGSNTAADHQVVLNAAFAQLPGHQPGGRPVRKVLVGIDGAGCSHAVPDWLTAQGVSYSVGFTLSTHTPDLLAMIGDQAWQPAYDADGQVWDGAWVAEPTVRM